MLTLIIFLLILSFLVVIHELGHFIAAKRAGVRVEEFGVGLPPKIYGKKIKDTLYSFNLLPIGGFVKLSGEDEGDDSGYSNDPQNFLNKKASTRAGILFAGVLMNFLFAFFAYYLILGLNGNKSLTIPLIKEYTFRFGQERRINTVVMALEDTSPAKQAGILPGDAVIEINERAVYSVSDVREALVGSENLEIKVLVMDLKNSKRETRAVSLKPVFNETEKRAQLGVLLGSATNISYESPVEKLLAGPMHAYNITSYTVSIFSSLIAASLETRDVSPVSTGVSGPVGIFSAVGELLKSSGRDRILGMFDFVALLSLSLGFMNLLPFPALDGGRMVFACIEMVTGRKLKPSREAIIHKVGMVFLLGFIVLVTFKDLKNLFN